MFVCLFFKEKLGVSRLNETTKIPGAGSQIASVLWSADKHFCVWARASIVIQMHIKCGDTEASLCFSQQNPPPPPHPPPKIHLIILFFRQHLCESQSDLVFVCVPRVSQNRRSR